MTTRKELVEALRERYRSAAFGDRIKILDEFVAVTGYHRKHAIRVLREEVATAKAALNLTRRRLATCLLSAVALPMAPSAAGADDWSALQPAGVVLFRHAQAPGGGDPPGFKLDDCRTQRNLSDEGRAQALRIGQAFKARGIVVGAVWSSQWCRTRETADIAFPRQRLDQPAFNSFFGDQDAAPEQTRAAQALLAGWRGPGVLVVSTHQVNITALTGIVPASGEGIVVKPGPQGLAVLGRIAP